MTIRLLHEKIIEAGIPIAGVSESPRSGVQGTRRVDFLPEATPEQQEAAWEIADGHNTLSVMSDKTAIEADDTEVATITMASGGNVSYKVYGADGSVDFENDPGTPLVPVGGIVTYQFKTPIADRYTVEFIVGNATGYVEVEAIDG